MNPQLQQFLNFSTHPKLPAVLPKSWLLGSAISVQKRGVQCAPWAHSHASASDRVSVLNATEAEMKGRIGAWRQNLKPVRSVFEGSVTSSSGPPHHLFPNPATVMLSGIEISPFCFLLYPLLPNSPGFKAIRRAPPSKKRTGPARGLC